MKIYCPACEILVPAEHLNVATDVGLCPECSETFAISSLVARGEQVDIPEAFDIHSPPPGAWYTETAEGWQVGATTRSKVALFLVPFMCVWSGFSLGGIYGSQIVQGEFDLQQSLFGLPFLFGTLLFGSFAVMSVCGKSTVTVADGQGQAFDGVGRIGWTRRFSWDAVEAIEESIGSVHGSHNPSGSQISLSGETRTNLAHMMTDERRYFTLNALKTKLGERR